MFTAGFTCYAHAHRCSEGHMTFRLTVILMFASGHASLQPIFMWGFLHTLMFVKAVFQIRMQIVFKRQKAPILCLSLKLVDDTVSPDRSLTSASDTWGH